MTPEEAKARVQRQDAKLAALEAEVARLASTNPTPVMLAIIRALVEMVCTSDGEVFRVHNKIKFYGAVVQMLRGKGIA